MKRIESSSVADVLIEAIDNAENMDHVLIISLGNDEGNYRCDGGLELPETIYILEKLKAHLLTCGDS